MTDNQHASLIKTRAAILNEAIREATEAGLTVTLSIDVANKPVFIGGVGSSIYHEEIGVVIARQL